MEKNSKNRITLTALIVFIVIGVFIVLLMVSTVTEEKGVTSKNTTVIKNLVDISPSPVVQNNTITNQVVEVEPPIVIENMEDSFSLEFLKMENNKSNMIYSPLSIKYALGMLAEGANGNTKIQIDNVIGRLNFTKYKNIEKILSLANGIYIRDTYAQYVKQSFRDNMINNFDAEVKYDPFNNADNVNSWIENKTFGILKNVLTDDIVTQSEMLLINALAIDMNWANEFDEGRTSGLPFYKENGENINATTMQKETKSEDISYYKDDNITAITMDLKKYNDTQLEFMAIMPEKNLDEYIKTITLKDVKEITNKLEKASNTPNGIEISIPKFEFNYNLQLKEDLKRLGIEDAFNSEKADFSNMADTSLFVSKAIHKADVKFSEEGIRAAAVTIFAMEKNSMLLPEYQPITVRIDKPFMFLIRDKATGEIWFVGTMYEPNLWENDKVEYKYSTEY